MKIFLGKWIRKAMSLLVSGKMIAWVMIMSIPSYLVWHEKILSGDYMKIVVAGIAIVTMRGIVEIAEVCKKGDKDDGLG